jgi:hypothetical protein
MSTDQLINILHLFTISKSLFSCNETLLNTTYILSIGTVIPPYALQKKTRSRQNLKKTKQDGRMMQLANDSVKALKEEKKRKPANAFHDFRNRLSRSLENSYLLFFVVAVFCANRCQK